MNSDSSFGKSSRGLDDGERLAGFLDFVGAQTTSANIHAPWSAIQDDSHFLDVRKPSAFGDVMGVTDFMTVERLLAAYSTFS